MKKLAIFALALLAVGCGSQESTPQVIVRTDTVYVDRPAPVNVVSDTTKVKLDVLRILNNGTLQELDSLPRVGEVKAKRLVAGRPYSSIDDAIRVKGIGEVTIADWKAINK